MLELWKWSNACDTKLRTVRESGLFLVLGVTSAAKWQLMKVVKGKWYTENE